jgi:hypothetical protein
VGCLGGQDIQQQKARSIAIAAEAGKIGLGGQAARSQRGDDMGGSLEPYKSDSAASKTDRRG